MKPRHEVCMTLGAIVGSLPPIIGSCASLGYAGLFNQDVLNLFF